MADEKSIACLLGAHDRCSGIACACSCGCRQRAVPIAATNQATVAVTENVWPDDDRPPGRSDIVCCACRCSGWKEHNHRLDAPVLVNILERAHRIAWDSLSPDVGDEDAIDELRQTLGRMVDLARQNARRTEG